MRKLFGPISVLFVLVAVIAIAAPAMGANPKPTVTSKKSVATPEAKCLALFDNPKIVEKYAAAAAALKAQEIASDDLCLVVNGKAPKVQGWVMRSCILDLTLSSLATEWRTAAKTLSLKPSRLCLLVNQFQADNN